MSLASPLVRRRNGKTQACEPCRQRKVACDHHYPVCNRCRRRPNGESTCYYATPDQRARSSAPTDPAQSPRKKATPNPPSSNAHVASEDRIWSSPAARAPLGFLGPTSFSAAYTETETNLAMRAPLASLEAESPLPPSSVPPSLSEIQEMVNMDQGASHLAVRVLQAIPTAPTGVTSFESQVPSSDRWMRMIGDRLLRSTWETFGMYLQDRGSLSRLREMGSMICINTRATCKEDQDDPSLWMQSFGGSNLRWESIGVIFACAAFAQISRTLDAEAEKVIRHYTEYCSSCVTLANMGGSSGSLMLFLLYKRSMLHAYLHGETSLPYWKSHAETVAMLTFSGFHDDQSRVPMTALSRSTVSMEMRKRVRCQIFVADKFIAAFVGRPPLLTRRFCALELPLDLDDAILLSNRDTFQKQLQQLDSDGWDTDGELCTSSLLRVRMAVALIRDEILELGLGHHSSQNADEIIRLKHQELLLYDGLPPKVVCGSALGDDKHKDPCVVYSKLVIRLDHLLNMFLIERLLVKHGNTRNDLLRAGFEMLILTLHIWTQKHIWAAAQSECQWLIMGFAAPAGAVLCMELMDPNPVSLAANESIILGENYSKSSVIQQLSLLVSCLKSSSSPTSSASKVSHIIKRVLDHVLNSTTQTDAPRELDGFDFTVDWDQFAQLNPLDTVNWFTGEWDEDLSTM